MSTTDTTHPSGIELAEDLVEETGGGLRIIELGLAVLAGLLVCPPLLILAVVVAVPAIATAAVGAALFAAIAVPTYLVRKVRAHHRAHGTTLVVHRLLHR
jgi:hypothetical protein